MPQSSTLWDQPYTRELIVDQNEDIDWINNDNCLENIKEPHFNTFNNNTDNMENSLINNFYDCSELDDSIHNYIIKGLLGEGSSNTDCVTINNNTNIQNLNGLNNNLNNNHSSNNNHHLNIINNNNDNNIINNGNLITNINCLNNKNSDLNFDSINNSNDIDIINGQNMIITSPSTSNLSSSCSSSSSSNMKNNNSLSFNSSKEISSNLMNMNIPFQIDKNQKRMRIESKDNIRIDVFDDNISTKEININDNQITELDSSKGRRWSNNSTTSTISSNFSINMNENINQNNSNINNNLSININQFQQDDFHSVKDLVPKNNIIDHNYDIGIIEDENFNVGNHNENEFFMNSDNFLTDDEKLKLRRRGRRRRPGEIEAWKTIIPRTTVDEAEHFVQTSQYRMRHVYRDPRAVSFVYRCVQHVDCQYEMRIYLMSHETCYVQHRGYHTEEKQKYKRPGLPQHTLPLIDELIRKGLPPKSVIDHAIQIYPEVADQSNISVLYRQITNRQQYIRKRQRNYI